MLAHYGMSTEATVNAADLLSASVAFLTLLATAFIAYYVASYGAQRAETAQDNRVEKDLLLRRAEEAYQAVMHLQERLLRRDDEGVTMTGALELLEVLGTRLNLLKDGLHEIGYAEAIDVLSIVFPGKGGGYIPLRQSLTSANVSTTAALDNPYVVSAHQQLAELAKQLFRLQLVINRKGSTSVAR